MKTKIIEMRKNGSSYDEIKVALKVSDGTISRALKSAGMTGNKRFSEKDKKDVERMVKKGVFIKDIGKKYGLSTVNMQYHMRTMGIFAGKSGRKSKASEIIALAPTHNVEETAKKLKTTVEYTRVVRRDAGVNKLNSEYTKERIEAMAKKGFSVSDIMKKLGITEFTVMKYIKGW